MLKVYKVLKQFDSSKDYGFEIRPQYARCLVVMKKGDEIDSKAFAKEHKNEFTQRRNTLEATLAVVYKAISIGKKIGVLKEIPNDSVPILYDDFCKLKTVSYFRSQLRGSNRKNIESVTNGTKDTYTRHLHYFNNWIFGKTLEYTKEIQTSKDSYKKETTKITIQGVEHFLKIFTDSHFDKKPFMKLIKSYFLESDLKIKSKSMRTNSFFAINEYFKKNDEPIGLTFDPNAGVQREDNDSEQIMTLDEFLSLLTIGKPSITEKAVLLCKFQRGLDSSTLVDRFNFEAWTKLVESFETEDYKKWDLKKCPILIELTRVKTNVSHFGFLDRDAISAIMEYLSYRKKITGQEMGDKEALFLNNFQKPIKETWITKNFERMRKNAGLDEILNQKAVDSGSRKKYRITPHETRDLLKSILIDSEVRYDLAEEFIGHKTKDSYEKQAHLFTATLRKEYVKASGRLNIFSKFKEISKGANSNEDLESKLEEMRLKMQKMDKKISRTSKLRKKS
jgi:hypothetical protein